MKKLAVLFVCVAMLASCDSFKGGSKDLKAENDSLLMELNQRNAELDDMMGTFNEVQEGFRKINAAESRVDLQRGTITENSASAKQQIASDIEFISKQMEENKQKKSGFVTLIGRPNVGKSTLMNIIGVLDKPTAGEYTLDGVNIHDAKDNQLADIRNRKIGFVFQTYNLIGRQSALKNVELPMLYAGVPGGERTRRAKEWLERVGMGERMKHQPNELSGGQKQRVAIARAMVNEPALILADEPTGALDSQTSRTVMDLFHEMHNTYHKTIVLITHNPELADECERVLTLRDGLIVGERKGSGKRAAL